MLEARTNTHVVDIASIQSGQAKFADLSLIKLAADDRGPLRGRCRVFALREFVSPP
jgi:hypothetical protein